MATTVSMKDIATPKSGHGCVTPPEMSIAPPTPPAGPIPAPFVYVARSATAENTDTALVAGGGECLIERSEMRIDMPGNKPTEPVKAMGGGDVVTHAICGIAVMIDGSGGTSSSGKRVCRTMDNVRMCLLMKEQKVAQGTVPLLLAGGGAFAGAAGTGSAKKEEAVRKALMAQAAHTGNKTAGPPKPDLESDPVAVATGAVVDEALDLVIHGDLPLLFRRTYSSQRSRERTWLGRGGWTCSFEQWVTRGEQVMIHRAADGRDIYFPHVSPGGRAFHRGERLTLSMERSGDYQIFDHRRRLTLSFSPEGEKASRAVLRSVRDPYGHAHVIDHHSGRPTRIADSRGREVRFSWEEGVIKRLEVWAAPPEADPTAPLSLAQWIDLAHHPEGELASVTDALGHAEKYEYDGLHRMIRKTNKNGLSFRYDYDPDTGRCVRASGDRGLFGVRLAHDLENRTTRVSGTHEPRLYTWDARGAVSRIEAPGALLEERTFDEDLYCVVSKNGAGEERIVERDAEARTTKIVDPAGNETNMLYPAEHLIRRTGPDGERRSVLDAHGALVRMESPAGSVGIERDAHGRVVQVHGKDGQIAAFAYDAHGNRVEVTNALGARVRYRFDSLGRVIALTDADGTIRMELDLLGRIVRTTYADGSEERVEYDPEGNVVRWTDAMGRETRIERTGAGQVSAVVTRDGQRWDFEHDDDGRLVAAKNPKREVYRFDYDRLGRLEREIPFDGRVIEYRYDSAGRVSRVDLPDGGYREMAYDPLGNLLDLRAPDGTVGYACGPSGRVDSAVMEDLAGKHEVKFERDEHGRVIAETQGSETIRWSYDDRGRLASRTVLGRTTRYYHDAAGALSAVDHEGYRLAITRDAKGRETRRHLYTPRADILSAYDAAGRLVAQRVTSGPRADVQVDRRLGYTAAGSPETITDARWGTSRYRHDAMDRLVEAQHPRLFEIFAYDANGTLAGVSRAPEAKEPGPWGKLTGDVLVRAGEARYVHDDQGRRVAKIERDANGGEARTTYAWDSRGQLREVALPSGDRVVFAYDAFGRRVQKAVFAKAHRDLPALVAAALEKGKEALPKPVVTRYLWDGNALAAEIGPGDRTRVFVNVPGALVPLLQDQGGRVYAYVQTPLGVPRELLDETGEVAWAALHGAFGDVVETRGEPERAGDIAPPFRLLGQIADPETGLTASLHRPFDPETGRFLAPDPLGFAGGTDLYGWNGSPLRVNDPLGLAVCTNITRDRQTAIEDSRANAGLPRNAKPEMEFVKTPVPYEDGDPTHIVINNDMSLKDMRSAFGALGPVEVHFNPNDPTGNTLVVVANHNDDPTRPPHTHAGTVPFDDPTGTYNKITPSNGDHHVYYGPW